MSELKAIIERKECFDVIILNYDLDEAEKISGVIRHDAHLFATPILAIINNLSNCKAQKILKEAMIFYVSIILSAIFIVGLRRWLRLVKYAENARL